MSEDLLDKDALYWKRTTFESSWNRGKVSVSNAALSSVGYKYTEDPESTDIFEVVLGGPFDVYSEIFDALDCLAELEDLFPQDVSIEGVTELYHLLADYSDSLNVVAKHRQILIGLMKGEDSAVQVDNATIEKIHTILGIDIDAMKQTLKDSALYLKKIATALIDSVIEDIDSVGASKDVKDEA